MAWRVGAGRGSVLAGADGPVLAVPDGWGVVWGEGRIEMEGLRVLACSPPIEPTGQDWLGQDLLAPSALAWAWPPPQPPPPPPPPLPLLPSQGGRPSASWS